MTEERGLLDQNGPIDDETGRQVAGTVVARRAEKLMATWQFVRFKGRCLVLRQGSYPHYVPLRKEAFDVMAYQLWGGLTRGQVSDMYAFVQHTAPDMDESAHLITFGNTAPPDDFEPFDEATEPADTETKTKPAPAPAPAPASTWSSPLVWDMRELEWQPNINPLETVWRSPYSPLATPLRFFNKHWDDPNQPRIPFILDLAGGDEGLYDDIMQSIAPIVMERKPDGVVWWVGSGANGKSTLMDALYRVFPGHFASITVKRLVDGRDTPSLNGHLANVVKESSEGRVDDTEVYKSLGTHENFRVHKFHSQEDTEINGNIHTIFSANTIPTFNDKGYSARRRTFIIPFLQQFESDPDFERRTFTQEFFQLLATEITHYAARLARQGYRYKWSAATTAAKLEYDVEASNGEEFARELIAQGVVAFETYTPLRLEYENWCAANGYAPLGITNLRKAMAAVGFERSSRRLEDKTKHVYRLRTVDTDAPLELLTLGRPGIFTTYGFRPERTQPILKTEPEAPSKPVQKSILEGKW